MQKKISADQCHKGNFSAAISYCQCLALIICRSEFSVRIEKSVMQLLTGFSMSQLTF
jgi:hypothetical protein